MSLADGDAGEAKDRVCERMALWRGAAVRTARSSDCLDNMAACEGRERIDDAKRPLNRKLSFVTFKLEGDAALGGFGNFGCGCLRQERLSLAALPGNEVERQFCAEHVPQLCGQA